MTQNQSWSFCSLFSFFVRSSWVGSGWSIWGTDRKGLPGCSLYRPLNQDAMQSCSFHAFYVPRGQPGCACVN